MRAARASGSALRALALLSIGGAASTALASDPIEQARLAELDRLRARVAGQIQLAACDLIDEVIYGWTEKPLFKNPTPVVLAGVTVPVGLGTGLQALLENHIAELLVANPTTHVVLTHCPACTAVLVHSGKKGTVVSRGVDNPEALEQLFNGAGKGRHALFVDVEAEGTWLVLRVRVTELSTDLPIIWARTLSSQASTPAMLRQPEQLKSVAQAQQEYIDALHDRGPLTVPLRFGMRTFAQGRYGMVAAPPLIWMQAGAELSPTQARAWTASIMLGYTNIPEAYSGLMAQARLSRLLTGRVRSLTRPDLYAFFGGALITVWGPAASAFRGRILTIEDVLADRDANRQPRATYGALHLGLEARISNRIGASWFLESVPSFRNSAVIGSYVDAGAIEFHSMGMEVTFCF